MAAEERLDNGLTNAAIAADFFIGDPVAFIAGEEGADARDIARIADTQRGALFKRCLQFLWQFAKGHGVPGTGLSRLEAFEQSSSGMTIRSCTRVALRPS